MSGGNFLNIGLVLEKPLEEALQYLSYKKDEGRQTRANMKAKTNK